MPRRFEPHVLGLLCTWCSYAAADAAGASHLAVPSCFHPIRVMCTGRIDMAWVLRAFTAGTDGILICGCHPGDCHYVDGNCKAQARVELMRTLLAQWQVEPERLQLAWVGSTESARFADIVRGFVEQMERMGPVRRGREGGP